MQGIAGSEQVQPRMDNVREMWAALKKLVDLRKQRLLGAVDYYQVKIAKYCVFLHFLTEFLAICANSVILGIIRHFFLNENQTK